MNKNKEDYRKFKRYWRLLLTSRLELNSSKWNKYLCFKQLTTDVDIVEYLINIDEELKSSYNLYQNLLYAIQRNDYELFNKVLYTDYGFISNYMETSLNTLKEFSSYI